MNAPLSQTPINHLDTSDSSVAQSHSKLDIERRSMRFAYSDIVGTQFYNDNPIVTAFWVGLSATFPQGENEFIQSVKLFNDRIHDPKLKRDVADFTAQEAHHSFHHKHLNRHFDSQGFNTAGIEGYMKKKLQHRKDNWTPEERLMRTVSAEHVTAVMAHYALTQKNSLTDTPDSFRDLLLWHSIEEIEHKSVAFDVYQSCVGDMPALKKHYAKFVFFEFPLSLLSMTRFLLKDRGHKVTWAQRKGMVKYLFGKGGMTSSVKHLYWMFLRKDFHPWNHDDSALVDTWKHKLEVNALEHS